MDALADFGLVAIKISPFFWKGTAVIICAFILFVGSVYLLLSAVFGLRMGYLVVAVSFFGWMIILSLLWAVGPGILGTPANLGPRGYEPHWQVFASGTGAVPSKYDPTAQFPEQPWKAPSGDQTTEVDTVRAVMQKYLAGLAMEELAREGQDVCGEETSAEGAPEAQSKCFTIDPSDFAIQDVKFAEDDATELVGAHGFYGLGGTELAVFAYFDKGNVQKYSIAFLVGSIVGFALHLPLLDRAERKRKEILTGGTAPPWFGPA